MLKRKFQVGDLVRCSCKLPTGGLFTKWHDSGYQFQFPATNYIHFRKIPFKRRFFIDEDVGLVKLSKQRNNKVYYEVAFMRSGYTFILPEEHIKRAK